MDYKNFNVALFCTSNGVEKIAGAGSFRKELSYLDKHIGYNKVYLETFRALNLHNKKKQLKDFIVKKEDLDYVLDFFKQKSIKTSGALTTFDIYSGDDTGFKSFCYSNHEQMEILKDITAYTAEFFDEIIIDDFYFTNCKCDLCIEKKGNRTWQQFRLEQMREISENVIKGTARAVNPEITLIIKYPNWYEDYHLTGYDLEKEPMIFDALYTGVETRDPEYTWQNTQKYLSYFIMRYMDKIKPGKNYGGWLDAFDCRHNVADYIMQLLFLLFSKPGEITLFSLDLLLESHQLFIPLAGSILREFDSLYHHLGNPAGLPCYKPFHSSGENYIHTYFGSLGFPLEPHCHFPDTDRLVFLTENAATDSEIIDKMKKHLNKGNDLLITSGLLKTLQEKGIDEITGVKVTGKKISMKKFAHTMFETAFNRYIDGGTSILFPQVEFPVNEAYPLIAGMCDFNSFPLLLKDHYSKGNIYILAVPENSGDLYNLPVEIIDKVKQIIFFHETIWIEGADKIALFLYDNSTFITASLLPYNTQIKIILNKKKGTLRDLSHNRELQGTVDGSRTMFTTTLLPAEYTLFKYSSPDTGEN